MTDPIRGLSGSDPAAEANLSPGAKTGQSAGGTAAGASAGTADSADVGQTQSLLHTINATAAAIPAVNQDRVESLRQAIANGSYRVDAGQVAKGLINSDAALPGAGPKE